MSAPALSIREYFALCVMQSLTSAAPEADPKALAARALALADALLVALYPPEPP